MNNMQSTNSTQNNFNDTTASVIPPAIRPDNVTYDDVVNTIDQFLACAENVSYQQQHHLKQGLTKSVGSKVTIHKLIKNFNTLILDHVNNTNRNMSMKQKNILCHYLDSVSSMGKILDNIEIKVAGDELLCYIIGYMIKTLKNVNVNTLYDNN